MQPTEKSSFLGLSKEEIKVHGRIKKYGDFTLTNAVSPSYDLKVVPKSGFWRGFYPKISVPFIIISASKESLFELFMEIARLISNSCVDIFIGDTHRRRRIHLKKDHESCRRHIDLSVALSMLYDFEELLVDDGYMGISIMNPETGVELRFDDHKLVVVFNWTTIMDKLLVILRKYKIKEDRQMKFIDEKEHMHSSIFAFRRQFNKLKICLFAR